VKALAFGRRLQQLLLPNLYEAVSVSKLRDKDMGDFRAATAKEPVLFENGAATTLHPGSRGSLRRGCRHDRRGSRAIRIGSGRRRIRCRQVCCMRILRWWCWRPAQCPVQPMSGFHSNCNTMPTDSSMEQLKYLESMQPVVPGAPVTFPVRHAGSSTQFCEVRYYRTIHFIGSAASDRRAPERSTAASMAVHRVWMCTGFWRKSAAPSRIPPIPAATVP